jgi:transposase InsO family protein
VELTERIKKLVKKHGRYGYRRIAVMLRREGKLVNTKRVHRIWKLERLQIPCRRPKRRRYGPNHVWSYDFVEDRTERGNKLRLLNVIDEFTRECLAIRVEPSMPAAKVIATLSWLFKLRGTPEHIRSDNGPEFIADALRDWLGKSGCATIYIEPGSPWENPYIESFNGKLRDECLNREIFANGAEARVIIENWRMEYNTQRPHSSLDNLTPVEFADVSRRARADRRLSA